MVITVRVSHRLLIPAACINPVFMIASVAGATHRSLHRCCCYCCRRRCYCCCCCCYCCCIAVRQSANGRESRIKSRKIENETASCRVTVRLNVETRAGGEQRAMVETRDTRRCGFSASLFRKVSSRLRFFFVRPLLAQRKTGIYIDSSRSMIHPAMTASISELAKIH